MAGHSRAQPVHPQSHTRTPPCEAVAAEGKVQRALAERAGEQELQCQQTDCPLPPA